MVSPFRKSNPDTVISVNPEIIRHLLVRHNDAHSIGRISDIIIIFSQRPADDSGDRKFLIHIPVFFPFKPKRLFRNGRIFWDFQPDRITGGDVQPVIVALPVHESFEDNRILFFHGRGVKAPFQKIICQFRKHLV